MKGYHRATQRRIGAQMARLLDGCPWPSRAAIYAALGNRENAGRALGRAMRRNLLVELEDGRFVRPARIEEVTP